MNRYEVHIYCKLTEKKAVIKQYSGKDWHQALSKCLQFIKSKHFEEIDMRFKSWDDQESDFMTHNFTLSLSGHKDESTDMIELLKDLHRSLELYPLTYNLILIENHVNEIRTIRL